MYTSSCSVALKWLVTLICLLLLKVLLAGLVVVSEDTGGGRVAYCWWSCLLRESLLFCAGRSLHLPVGVRVQW